MQALKSYIEAHYNPTVNVKNSDVNCQFKSDNVKAIYYQVKKDNEVFAFIGVPDSPPPQGGYPAVLLVHGGMGFAYHEWVKTWTDRGYVAIAPDFDSQYTVDDEHRAEYNEKGGPKGYGSVKDFQSENAWLYFSVLSCKKALDILAENPLVNKEKFFVEGISWGGFVSLVLLSQDDRLKAGAIKYSTAYISQTSWGLNDMEIKDLSEEEKKVYDNFIDPQTYLPNIKVPVLFATGVNDPVFTVRFRKKTTDNILSKKVFSYRADFPHGHYIGWEGIESQVFFENIDGRLPSVSFDKGNGFVGVDDENCTLSLIYTEEEVFEKDFCEWKETPIERGNADISKQMKYCIITATRNDGYIFSTDLIRIYMEEK